MGSLLTTTCGCHSSPPDGTKVVFNHAKADPNRPGFTDRRELAVMDYDRATQTFSNQ